MLKALQMLLKSLQGLLIALQALIKALQVSLKALQVLFKTLPGLLKALQELLKVLKRLPEILQGLLKAFQVLLRRLPSQLHTALIERCAAAMEDAQQRIPFRYNNCIKTSSNYTRYLVATPRVKHINVVLYWQSAHFVWLNLAVGILQASVNG